MEMSIWIALFLMLGTSLVATAIENHRCHNKFDTRIEKAGLHMDQQIRREEIAAAHSNWLHRQNINEDRRKAKQRINELVRKNNRLILKNKELKNMLSFDPKTVKYVVLKGSSLPLINWSRDKS